MPLQSKEVRCGSTQVNAGHGADRAADVVPREVHVMYVREICNLASLEEPHLLHIRAEKPEARLPNQALKINAEVIVLTSCYRCPGCSLNLVSPASYP